MKLLLSPTGDEWILFALIFLALGCFVAAAELIRKKMQWSPEVTRKSVHIAVGVLIYFAPQLFTSGIPAMLLAITFTLSNLIAIRMGLLKGMHGTNRRSYGTVYYPLSFLILVILLWNTYSAIISIAIMILAELKVQAAEILTQTSESARDAMMAQGMIVDIEADEGTLEELLANSDAAEGALEANQVNNQLVGLQTNQMMRLQVINAASARLQASQYDEQVQKKLMTEAEADRFSTRKSKDNPLQGGGEGQGFVDFK